MRILAIGDIHGSLQSLEAMAGVVQFQENDLIITLGDYIDRGPNSKGVLNFLIKLQQQHQLIPLRGNHEATILKARNDQNVRVNWLRPGFDGDATLASYGAHLQALSIDLIPESHWQFLESTQPFYETENHFFVHANADPSLALKDQGEHTLFWEFFDHPAAHFSGKTMICGHSSVGEFPKNLGHAVCIDTGAGSGGWLTCLDITRGIFYQTNEKGQVRKDVLSAHLKV